MNMKKVIIALLIGGFSTTVNAFSGADLLAQCKHFVEIIDGSKADTQGVLQAGLCGGYVLGVQEGFIASSELADVVSEETGSPIVTKRHWKIPSDVESEKIVRIVVRYLEINPDMHNLPAVLSVLNALRQTYPAKE
jgi:hypothetical protein